MSKTIRALLGTLILCVPAVAATTISGDEVGIRLRGLAETAPGHYELAPGTLALLEVNAHRGDLLFVYAVPLDLWGEPDLGRVIPLVEGQRVDANGRYLQFFTIPEIAAGRIFKVQALAFDRKNLVHSSPELTIAVSDAQILNAPQLSPPHLDQAAPVIVN